MTKILVVDDDKQIVRLVSAYLEQAGYEVLAAYDGDRAIETVRAERPELLVLDVMLPNRDGWDVTRSIRADPAARGTPIILLTARVEDSDKIVGLELGADDYVTKPFNPAEVVARVRAVLRRAQGLPEQASVLQVGDLVLDRGRHEVAVAGRVAPLTPTEFELLATLMTYPGRVYTRAELLSAATDDPYEGLERTIDSHVKNLRRKIEPDPRHPAFVETVYGVGYRLRPKGDGGGAP